MSGNIKLEVRKGRSKDKRYNFYPEAYLKITGECGTEVNLSPSYNDLCEMLKAFRRHELKVDITRERKNYLSRLILQLEGLLKELKEIQLSEYDQETIEQIYHQQKAK